MILASWKVGLHGKLCKLWYTSFVSKKQSCKDTSTSLTSTSRPGNLNFHLSTKILWINERPITSFSRTWTHVHVRYLLSPVRLSVVCRLSVCLSVCLSSVTFVRATQAIQIFSNISTALGTLAIRWHSLKISRRSSQGNPSAGGVKHKRGSQI